MKKVVTLVIMLACMVTFSGVVSQAAPQALADSASVQAMVNLNQAEVEQLATLPGIGPAIAQRIIEYRSKVGGFTSIDQVLQVKGVGEKTLGKISSMVTVE